MRIERWSVILAMGWNLKVLNRLRGCRVLERGDIDHTGELGDNLRENTNDLGRSETWTNEIIGRIASAPSSVTRKDVGYEPQKNPGEESRSR